nr:sn-glycerol-3-phosphate transporter [Pseudomonas insulae]
MLLGAATLALLAGVAQADDQPFWYLQTSVYTTHWSHDPEHNNHQNLIGVERHNADGRFIGAATFRNSYRQRTQYAYVGKRYEAASLPVCAKLSAGFIQGYRGEYRDKIPLNRYGVAPAIIPALGAHWDSVGAELVLFGNAGAMLTSGLRY